MVETPPDTIHIGIIRRSEDVSCPHARVEPWRRQFFSSNGKHGPERTRSVAGEIVFRSWTNCADCGVRLERALLTKGQADR